MVESLAIVALSVGLIIVALMYAMLSREVRRRSDEITELQALADLNLLEHGKPPVYAPRYDLDLERLDEDDE